MTKKIILLASFVFVITIFVACTQETEEKFSNKNIEVDSEYVFDIEAIKTSGDGIYNERIILDETFALEYSNIIFEKILKKDINKYKDIFINYDKDKEIWVTTYCMGNETVGGDINIAINGKTGKVVLIWAGE